MMVACQARQKGSATTSYTGDSPTVNSKLDKLRHNGVSAPIK
jgi:hypothetical protein